MKKLIWIIIYNPMVIFVKFVILSLKFHKLNLKGLQLFVDLMRTKELLPSAKNATAISALTVRWIILIMLRAIWKMLRKKSCSRRSIKKEMISKQSLMNSIKSILNSKIFSTSKQLLIKMSSLNYFIRNKNI